MVLKLQRGMRLPQRDSEQGVASTDKKQPVVTPSSTASVGNMGVNLGGGCCC